MRDSNFKELFSHYPGLYASDAASRDMDTDREIHVVFNAEETTYARVYRPLEDRQDDRLLSLNCVLEKVRAKQGCYAYDNENTDNLLLVIYTLSGNGRVIYDDHIYYTKVGDCMILDSRRPYRLFVHSDIPWEYHMILFHGPSSEPFLEQIHEARNNMIHFPSDDIFMTLLKRLSNACIIPSKGTMIIHCVLCELLLHFISDPPIQSNLNKPAKYDEIKQFLEQNYARTISLAELEQTFCISKYHLSRTFKQYYGVTPAEYQVQVRMKIVKQLILQSDMSIAEIAETTGYSYTHHMIKVFKAFEGMTPLAFRKTNGVKGKEETVISPKRV